MKGSLAAASLDVRWPVEARRKAPGNVQGCRLWLLIGHKTSNKPPKNHQKTKQENKQTITKPIGKTKPTWKTSNQQQPTGKQAHQQPTGKTNHSYGKNNLKNGKPPGTSSGRSRLMQRQEMVSQRLAELQGRSLLFSFNLSELLMTRTLNIWMLYIYFPLQKFFLKINHGFFLVGNNNSSFEHRRCPGAFAPGAPRLRGLGRRSRAAGGHGEAAEVVGWSVGGRLVGEKFFFFFFFFVGKIYRRLLLLVFFFWENRMKTSLAGWFGWNTRVLGKSPDEEQRWPVREISEKEHR